MTNTAAQIAKSAKISPRTKTVKIRDEFGLVYDGSRFDHVMARLCRSDLTPELDFCTHVVAMALHKSISTARMHPTSSLRIQAYSPYQLCKLVARIADECPETTIGGICDGWIPAHHSEL
jgi:hypothetical protein